jgi:hypothetical protein
MCSPELCRGTCCICFGTLTPETTLYEDLGEGRGGVHRGKCAILAGLSMTSEQKSIVDDLILSAHNMEPNSPERQQADITYYRYVEAITTEDYYDNSGPP